MRFAKKKHRTPPAIIIISLIDILIVLLIFMVVTTTFRQQPALKIALPESKQTKSGSSEEEILVITIDKKEPYLYLEQNPITTERLEAELKNRVAKNPKVNLAIRADTMAPFGQILKVSDIAKAANIKVVNAFTKKPGQ